MDEPHVKDIVWDRIVQMISSLNLSEHPIHPMKAIRDATEMKVEDIHDILRYLCESEYLEDAVRSTVECAAHDHGITLPEEAE